MKGVAGGVNVFRRACLQVGNVLLQGHACSTTQQPFQQKAAAETDQLNNLPVVPKSSAGPACRSAMSSFRGTSAAQHKHNPSRSSSRNGSGAQSACSVNVLGRARLQVSNVLLQGHICRMA
jgi:hypothetical protein